MKLGIGFTQSTENIYEVSDEILPKLKNSSDLQIQNLMKSLISRLTRMSQTPMECWKSKVLVID